MTSPTDLSTPAKRRGRPWFPIIVSLLGITAVVAVLAWPELERNLTQWLLGAIPLLVLPLLLLWFLVTPRFTRRTRFGSLALLVLIGLGVKAAVRVDGTMDGTGLPRLAWKWSGTSRASLTTPPPTEAAALPSADPRLAGAADVRQFFGPERDGTVKAPPLARDWNATPPRELWRQPIGEGWSAFAVVQGRAFTQEQRGPDELVTCYDLFTGKLLWAQADQTRFSQWQSGDGPHATPTVDGGRVYSYGGTGLLNCLDAATGKLIWQKSVLTGHKLDNLEWGISASPLLVDDKVIVTGGNTTGPVLFAWNRETGAPVWQTGHDRATYASPILTTLGDRRVILANHARALTAHDPTTGEVLMEQLWGMDKWPKASQPVVIGPDRVFVSAGYGMGCVMFEIKPAADGKLSATELWSSMKMKTQFNSPALRGGHLYGLDDGKMACLSTTDGERLWKEGRFGSGQSLLTEDLVIVQNESGPVHLISAQPDGYQELGRIDALSSKTWNHPVLAGRYLLVRNDREAVCYELPVKP